MSTQGISLASVEEDYMRQLLNMMNCEMADELGRKFRGKCVLRIYNTYVFFFGHGIKMHFVGAGLLAVESLDGPISLDIENSFNNKPLI